MSDEPQYKPDSLDITPEMGALELLSDIRKTNPSKMFAICLWDDGNNYSTSFVNAGLKVSEIVALLEAMKLRMLRHLVPPSPRSDTPDHG